MTFAPEGPVRFIAEGRSDVGAEAFAESVPLGDHAGASNEEGVLHLVHASADTRGLHPWDAAHAALDDQGRLESREAVTYLEPDFMNVFPVQAPRREFFAESFHTQTCTIETYDKHWKPDEGTRAPGWHLENGYTGLRAARALASGGPHARIGILDTGYDPIHKTRPRRLLEALSKNVSGDGHPDDATDPGRHFPTFQPGHGTATTAILAGGHVNQIGSHSFGDDLGGAPEAEVVHIRIANSVVHFRSSSMARGIQLAVESGCQVISVSMGGIPTRAWARAVNAAYEKGVVICAAAGNRIGQSPPKYIVYPARFERVIAVCGATAEHKPYYKGGWHMQMHGSFGPTKKMNTAMAAYTPNIPWAEMGCTDLVNPNGAGTSSATPQVAATAALYYSLYKDDLPQDGAVRAEAVRQALFNSATLPAPKDAKRFGQGLLRAPRALAIAPDATAVPAPRASLRFPLLRMLIGIESVPGDSPDTALLGHERMFEVEALQLYERSPALQNIVPDWDPMGDDMPSKADRKKLLKAMIATSSASQSLRKHLEEVLKRS